MCLLMYIMSSIHILYLYYLVSLFLILSHNSHPAQVQYVVQDKIHYNDTTLKLPIKDYFLHLSSLQLRITQGIISCTLELYLLSSIQRCLCHLRCGCIVARLVVCQSILSLHILHEVSCCSRERVAQWLQQSMASQFASPFNNSSGFL